jgi:hypothetical protein
VPDSAPVPGVEFVDRLLVPADRGHRL